MNWSLSYEVDVGALLSAAWLALLWLYVLVWFAGTLDLFNGGHRALGWIAISGLVIFPWSLVAIAGFFILPRPGSDAFESADGWTRGRSMAKYPGDYQWYRHAKGLSTAPAARSPHTAVASPG